MPFPAGPAAGGWSARRRRHPPRAPASRGRGRRCCGDAVRLPAGGGAAGHRRPWLLGRHDLAPLLPSARGCRPPSRSRRRTGRDRSRAASPRALPSPLPRWAPSPPPRRPLAPAAVSAGGGGGRRFRCPGIGRREDRLPAAEARSDAWMGSPCLCEWVCLGGVCVCLGSFLASTDFSPPGCGEGLSSAGAGGSGPSAGCQASAGGSFICASPPLRERRSPSSASAASFCETGAYLSRIKPFVSAQTTLIVFCGRISLRFLPFSFPPSVAVS